MPSVCVRLRCERPRSVSLHMDILSNCAPSLSVSSKKKSSIQSELVSQKTWQSRPQPSTVPLRTQAHSPKGDRSIVSTTDLIQNSVRKAPKGNERQVAGQKGRKVNIRAKETLEDAENQWTGGMNNTYTTNIGSERVVFSTMWQASWNDSVNNNERSDDERDNTK